MIVDAYGFSHNALNLIFSYLSGRRHRVKVSGTFSSWCYSKIRVPQGSVLGPLLFNIFINDIFYLVNDTEVCNYVDDTTLYVGDKNLRIVLSKLERDTLLLSEWFSDNFMKLNEEKSHLLIFGANSGRMTLNIGATLIPESESEKLLGVTIDSKLNFKFYVNRLCAKASQKLHALARVSNYMDTEKVKLIMRSFIMSHFNYCPLIWMFHDRSTNSRINKTHERALQIVYRDTESSFDELLTKDNSVSVHQRNLQLLMIEIYKTKNSLNPSFMEDICVERPNITYDLRNKAGLLVPRANTTAHGIETIKYIGSRLWQTLPSENREYRTLEIFKGRIKNWKADKCNCKLCKTFIANLGYI